MKLEGTIETIPLRELIDMISYSSVTGALNIYTGLVAGHLFFRDGNLYHCDCGEQTGVVALAQLFELSEGGFSFVGDVTSDQETLWGDMGYHVQTAERLAQRWQHIRPRITSSQIVPILIVPHDTALRRVGPFHHQLLDHINGNHSLKDIVAELGWTEIDVAEAIAQMMHDGVVDIQKEGKSESTSAPSATGTVRGSLFDRLRPRSNETNRQQTPPSQHNTETPRGSTEEMLLQMLRS